MDKSKSKGTLLKFELSSTIIQMSARKDVS